ncbi:FAD-dependent oxidoreductase [Nocardioides sp. DS6]|uniref:FAD-dependent oxidoreductase n=1 Tax=Nocardioides eburneus TaxID=3231482 RepID=A0ABV3SXN3_9ACTN
MLQASADVVVVGGGPSGLVVAAEAAAGGARVVLLEQRVEGTTSRAGTILPRVLEILDSRGLSGRIMKRAQETRSYPYDSGHIWAGFEWVEWRHLESRYGMTMMIPQGITESILREWAAESGADCRYGWAADDVEISETGASVRGTGPEGAFEVRAPYVVGADGVRSLVRDRAGIAFKGRPASFTGVIADAYWDYRWPSGRRHFDNELGWVSAFQFGPGITRFIMVHRDERNRPKGDPIDAVELSERLGEVIEEQIEFTELASASRFTDSHRIVDSFRTGPVFLVGEAARVHYPASGVGMNFCIQDAFNLGWKLGAVCAGHADDALLDTYDTERRPVAQELLQSVDAQVAIQFNFSPEGVAMKRRFAEHMFELPDVQRHICKELNGLTVAYDTQANDPLGGLPMPDIDVATIGAEIVRIAELLRDHRFVLLVLERNVDLDLGPFEELCSTVVCRATRRPAALDGVDAVLIRPDGYVSWVRRTGEVTPTVEEHLKLLLGK